MSKFRHFAAMACKYPERLLFPSFLLAAQAVFFVLFFLFVRYDVGGRANREIELLLELNETGGASARH